MVRIEKQWNRLLCDPVEILSLDVLKDKLGENLENRCSWFCLESKGSFSLL